jgi:hypothetical protein
MASPHYCIPNEADVNFKATHVRLVFGMLPPTQLQGTGLKYDTPGLCGSVTQHMHVHDSTCPLRACRHRPTAPLSWLQ